MRNLPAANADLIDLADVGRGVRAHWRHVLAGLVLGGAAAAGVLAFAPRRFEGSSTVLLRSGTDAGASLLSRLGVPVDMSPSGLGSLTKSPMETELQILSSRAVLDVVADSLGLQARVLSPRGVPASAVLLPRAYAGSFKRRVFAFDGAPGGYRVTGAGVDTTVPAGGTVHTPVGPLALRPAGLPAAFTVELLDEEDALQRMGERLAVDKAGGEVARVAFRAGDSLTAAQVPNAVVAVYLRRRVTTDRGTNQHRAEFLAAQVDSVGAQLLTAERQLRLEQESSGVFDPALTGKSELEGAAQVRAQLAAVQVEESALNAMLAQVRAGTMSARQLAAYPSFLRSPAINELLAQTATLETQRNALMESRTATAPEVVAVTQSIENLERQLAPLGTAYAGALARQHSELARQASRFDVALDALPGQAESSSRLQREVRRLGQTLVALQTQLVEARLAAVGEGGDVRQLDAAAPSKRPAFPRPAPTLAIGLLAGLLFGVLSALRAAFFGRWIRTCEDAERLTGIPTTALASDTPLVLGALRRYRTVAVVPVGKRADATAVAALISRAAEAARARALGSAASVPARIALPAHAEHERHAVDGDVAGPVDVSVLASLGDPGALAALDDRTPVVLVARAGSLSRRELTRAVEVLRAAAVPCAGLVLQGLSPDAA